MTDTFSLNLSGFPSSGSEIRANWAPVYLEPIMGSGERLTIGLAVVSDDTYTVLSANKLSRFQCLYGKSGADVEFLAEAALDALRLDISERGLDALTEPHPPVAGLHIGEIREGAGTTVDAIALAWLPGLSSLVSASDQFASISKPVGAHTHEEAALPTRDQLPKRVAEEVIALRPGLVDFFRTELRPDGHARKITKGHKVTIDYVGAKIVANFCTLYGYKPSQAARDIKHRLWDLKVDRDGSGKLPGFYRDHELLVFRPANDDPNYTDKQLENVSEALEELKSQADQEDIRLRPLVSVKDIAKHILNAER